MDINELYNADCLDIMREMPDKSVDLVITDPPYGIGDFGDRVDKTFMINEWDIKPSQEYLDEIFRISKNQIIFGGNYFDLPSTSCFLIWDKEQPEAFSFAMCEYAWTSFKSPAQMFRYRAVGLHIVKVHPTQKPVPLFEWIIRNYAKEGDIICDPFFGSGSCIVAAVRMGHPFIGIEKEKMYFDAAEKRIKKAQEQGKISAWFGEPKGVEKICITH